ncbi:MAG: AAA family ATPase [Acidobacteria bacterium]|nr:AAA family ATPase [Acidobacteriota bacterium]
MLVEDQRNVIDFLSAPGTHGGAAVERIDTHASVVVLARDRAWKLKRAVEYDYLDFSTVERRKAMCDAEVRVNRRTAPDLYLGVAAVTLEADGRLALNGAGRPVDWLVEMRRFDQDQLVDRLAGRGALDVALARRLAVAIARFHAVAEPRRDHGGAAGMRWVVDGNARGFAEEGHGILEPAEADVLTQAARSELDRRQSLLDDRRANGFVRQCHGDLHLRNIVIYAGEPTLFDAIEFNDEIACIDVWYDLAFLLMDLWRANLRSQAHAVLNEYLAAAGDLAGTALLPLFLSCRAAVRAKTSASSARLQTDPAEAARYRTLSRAYLRMAVDLIRAPAPVLVAIGGFSGSGKSTVALQLGPDVGRVPGAVVLRSDEIRKRLLGVSPLTRLEAEGYGADVSARVYETIAERARALLGAGHAVIADAVFAKAEDRRRIEEVAASAGVPFVGIWLEAPESTLVERAARRGPDPSDATADVIRRQVDTGAGAIAWTRIDSSSNLPDVARRAADPIRARLGTPRASEP